MRRTIYYPILFCIALFSIGTIGTPAFAQNSVTGTAKKVVKQAEKTTQKLTKRTKRTARKTVAQAKAAVKTSANTIASVLRNLPTPAWSKLASAYDYDSSTPPDVKEEPIDWPNAFAQHITFTGPEGKPVEGLFLRPKADGIYPCALVLHGLTNNKETAVKMFGNALVARGVAVLALDAPEHGENHKPGKGYWNSEVIMHAVHEGDRNYRRALDYLAQRQDVDNSRIGALGYSLGAIMSSILGGVDPRVSYFSLCVGGDPFLPLARVAPPDAREAILDISPSLFVSHISPRPILFQNGKEDVIIVPPAAYLLQNSAKSPKQVIWFNGGHDIPKPIAARAVTWLATKLKAEAPPNPNSAAGQKGEPKR